MGFGEPRTRSLHRGLRSSPPAPSGLLPPPPAGAAARGATAPGPPAPSPALGNRGPKGSPRSTPAGQGRARAGSRPHRGELPGPAPPARRSALTRRTAVEAAASGQAVLPGLGVAVAAVALPPPLQFGGGARAEPPAPRHAGTGSTCPSTTPPSPFPLPAPAAILSEGTAALRGSRLPAGQVGSGVGEAKRGRARLGLGWETRGA